MTLMYRQKKVAMNSELKKDTLGIFQSLIIGVAGSAPSFSISATLAALIAAVGILAPASLLYCGMMMIGIVLAYMHLNAHRPNSGASFAWVTEIFGTSLGFFAGWALLVASALFMVSASIPAGAATLRGFSNCDHSLRHWVAHRNYHLGGERDRPHRESPNRDDFN